MKTLFLPAFSALIVCLSSIRASEEPRILALQAADDARIAAVKAADSAQLREILSDALHYGHSSGSVDTKASFIDSLVSGRAKYSVYENEERKFTFPSPGIALMSGRAHVKVETATGGMDSQVGYLAVWREEKGKWRFLAWQACRMASPAAVR
ncbi:MAG TPA: nuclear transport factor 2 family protein [Verrucomicrobiae bacterium]|nr:nuclear transport factor 2 family protein [Verrucomicrobiae bacterium]